MMNIILTRRLFVYFRWQIRRKCESMTTSTGHHITICCLLNAPLHFLKLASFFTIMFTFTTIPMTSFNQPDDACRSRSNGSGVSKLFSRRNTHVLLIYHNSNSVIVADSLNVTNVVYMFYCECDDRAKHGHDLLH